MIIVVVIMTIILLMIFMRTPTSLIYCLTVSSVFWPDIDSIIFSAASSKHLKGRSGPRVSHVFDSHIAGWL